VAQGTALPGARKPPPSCLPGCCWKVVSGSALVLTHTTFLTFPFSAVCEQCIYISAYDSSIKSL
jgi:hypothetical protein